MELELCAVCKCCARSGAGELSHAALLATCRQTQMMERVRLRQSVIDMWVLGMVNMRRLLIGAGARLFDEQPISQPATKHACKCMHAVIWRLHGSARGVSLQV